MVVRRDAPSVILIDDNPRHLDLLTMSLRDHVANGDLVITEPILTVTDPVEAITRLPAEGPAVIICDYKMPEADALEWLPELLKPDLGPVIVLTSAGDEQVAAEAFRSGASDYLVKSRALDEPQLLLRSIRESLRRHKLEQSNRALARQLKITNYDLERKNLRLHELTETAHRFVDNVAHEFRTPLAVIQEFTAIIRDGIGGTVTEDQLEYLQFIASATRDLSQLVDDFLDTSKLKTGALRVDRCSHPVQALLDATRPLLQARARSKQIQIEEQIDAQLPPVFADLDKAGRTLLNLVVNAIKFSPEESRIQLSARRDDGGDVAISVTDQGPGLTPEEIAVVGQRFRQVGEAAESTKGFGLGLSIARELIGLNLGRFDLRSEPGAGSTFSFTLVPDDPAAVLDRYVDVVTALSGANLAVLTIDQGPAAADSEALRRFLTSACYPMDLLLKSVTGRSVLALGVTAQPDRWARRLESAWAAQRREQPAAASGELNIDLIGQWSNGAIRDAVHANVLERVTEVRISA